MTKKQQNLNRLVDAGTTYSIVIYVITALLKIVFGRLGNSNALFTDGLNSVSDVLSTVILYIGLQLSRKPSDSNHTYGHFRIEQIATLIASFIMMFIGLQALMDTFSKFLSPERTTPSLLTAIIACISIVLILSSAIINYYIAKKTNISAARAVMKNNVSDAFTAVGALIAILTSRLNMPIIDIIASFIISLIIIRTAISIFMDAGINLSDGFDEKELQRYRKAIADMPEVASVIDLRGRMLGNNTALDVIIAVDGNMSVSASHDIADYVEDKMKQEYGIYRTLVHVEPLQNITKTENKKT